MTACRARTDPALPTRLFTMLSRTVAGLLLAMLGLLSACSAPASRTPVVASQVEPIVVLVSIDGFRTDYLAHPRTPRLQALARDGVHAAMRPSYPTLTFPNHYTLVTGLRPDRHGVVGNRMIDPVLGRFQSSDGHSAADGRWFDDAEPLWVTARRAGLITATMYWPGSEAEIRGLRPHHWRPYRDAVSSAERSAGVLAWLDVPPPHRPRLITLYFGAVDHAGHHHGPDSPKLADALGEVDEAIGQLVDGIAARGLSAQVALIVVSDHGMAPGSPRQVALLDEHIDPDWLAAIEPGETGGLWPRPESHAKVERALLGRHDAFECWRRGELPPQWHFGRHRRVAPIVCQADEGWRLETRAGLAAEGGEVNPGGHGYPPELPSMQAIFIANGRVFHRGVELPAFDNVEVYPLLAYLLGIRPQPNDAVGVLAGRVLQHP